MSRLNVPAEIRSQSAAGSAGWTCGSVVLIPGRICRASSVEWPQQQSKGSVDMPLIKFIKCRRFIAGTVPKVEILIGAERPIWTPHQGVYAAPKTCP